MEEADAPGRVTCGGGQWVTFPKHPALRVPVRSCILPHGSVSLEYGTPPGAEVKKNLSRKTS